MHLLDLLKPAKSEADERRVMVIDLLGAKKTIGKLPS
jgi:hypothetical protein